MFLEGQEILEKRYKVMKKVGAGAFGEIYKGKVHLSSHISTFSQYFIITYHNALQYLIIVEKKKTGEILAAKVVS